MGAAQVEALAAHELHPRGVAGQGKPKGIAFPGVARQAVSAGRVDDDLVRKGAKGRQHTGAVDYDAGVGLLDYGQGHVGAVFEGSPHGVAAALEVDQGMGEGQVVFPDVFEVVSIFCLNSGRFWPQNSLAAAMDMTATLRKSGVRPIIPQVTLAQWRIIFPRRSNSSRVLGIMKESPTWSPEEGDLKVISGPISGWC